MDCVGGRQEDELYHHNNDRYFSFQIQGGARKKIDRFVVQARDRGETVERKKQTG